MINFEERLLALKGRRQGSREREIIRKLGPSSACVAILERGDIRVQEDYELIAESSGIKYLLGATEPIDAAYTESLIDDGMFIVEMVVRAFEALGERVEFYFQGALACNVHVKKYDCFEIALISKLSSADRWQENTYDLVAFLANFRIQLESVLREMFYNEFIGVIEEGFVLFKDGKTIRRAVITPAVCYEEYACVSRFGASINMHEKGGYLVCHNPKKLLKLIDERDALYFGNMRRVIRLFFNVVADMSDNNKAMVAPLSECELMSIAYSMSTELDTFPGNIPGLLERVRRYLQFICDSEKLRMSIVCLDSGRKVFGRHEKVVALEILRSEFRELSSATYREISPCSSIYNPDVMFNKFIA